MTFTKAFAESTALEATCSLPLEQGQARVLKDEISKHLGFLSSGPLSCNATHSVCSVTCPFVLPLGTGPQGVSAKMMVWLLLLCQ